jgi:L-threonylcarbamoyladenylate synthase
MIRVVVDPRSPDPAAIELAATAIRAGKLVALPTDTLYGLAADPFNRDAVARVFAAKGREAGKALPLIAADRAQIEASLGPLPATARALAERFWPGPLTLLVAAPPALVSGATGGAARVGVRVPDHPIARALCRAAGSPLTATSANVSGQPATADPDVVAASLASHVDVLLDGGPAAGGQPSTIVDVLDSTMTLIRAGAIPWEAIEAWRHV